MHCSYYGTFIAHVFSLLASIFTITYTQYNNSSNVGHLVNIALFLVVVNSSVSLVRYGKYSAHLVITKALDYQNSPRTFYVFFAKMEFRQFLKFMKKMHAFILHSQVQVVMRKVKS